MKKKILALLALYLTFVLTGCGNQPASEPSVQPQTQTESKSLQNEDVTEESLSDQDGGEVSADNSNILIYPDHLNVDTDGVNAISGISIVVDDGETLGNVQFMANPIRETTSGDMSRIKTVNEYSLEYDALVDFAADKQHENARPGLAAYVENMEKYDVVFLWRNTICRAKP